MQTDNQLFDDFTKFLNGAVGTVAGIAREGSEAARERAKEFFGGLDFVAREEFEAVKAMAAAARNDADALAARVAALEAQLAAKPAAQPAAAKPAAAPKAPKAPKPPKAGV
jgi:BMFP domain-containing protein YqiC